ncbi:hypothetical protein [Flavobacterium saccharophilum]|uniref:HNH endonuclease n=1 Tax=Flavobacterium saccharophilum TaxID=29534 RepID=A0A1M7FL49_9FLAO|nr:hypothetical protein [Flavobacterium saccharophilum]SHM04784.1 hypothetical protein SAMN05444366_2170 [Flavobacterium saccharophilum]
MLQNIKQPASIYKNQLHNWIEHLVCNVWCEASLVCTAESLLMADFKKLYTKYEWLKRDIDDIYTLCSKLSVASKRKIKDAFIKTNQIEKLCENDVQLVMLDKLPNVVKLKMKPFFENLYKDLLDKKLSPISKMEYYKELQSLNNFINCPCCGYMPFEGVFSKNREDLDHFFSKAHFPFASINLNNLSPLCGKCNSDNKRDFNPVLGKLGQERKAFYPYQANPTNIQIEITLSKDFTNIIQDILVNNLNPKISQKQIKITLKGGEQDKVNTWNELYNIKSRYFDRTQGFTNSVLKKIFKKKTKLGDYSAAIKEYIDEIDHELYVHEHFIQIPFVTALDLQLNNSI